MLNETQIAIIAGSTNHLRPNWNVAAIRAVIRKLPTHHTPSQVAAALAYVACDPETRQPTRILEGGPWWPSVIASAPKLARKSEPTDCHICGRPKHEPIPGDHEYIQRDSIQRASPEAIEAAKKALTNPTPDERPAA